MIKNFNRIFLCFQWQIETTIINVDLKKAPVSSTDSNMRLSDQYVTGFLFIYSICNFVSSVAVSSICKQGMTIHKP